MKTYKDGLYSELGILMCPMGNRKEGFDGCLPSQCQFAFPVGPGCPGLLFTTRMGWKLGNLSMCRLPSEKVWGCGVTGSPGVICYSMAWLIAAFLPPNTSQTLTVFRQCHGYPQPHLGMWGKSKTLTHPLATAGGSRGRGDTIALVPPRVGL